MPVLYRLHQIIHLAYLLLCDGLSSALILYTCPSSTASKQGNLPFILCSFAWSNLSPSQLSPSIFCAYDCHSAKKPTYNSVSNHHHQPSHTIRICLTYQMHRVLDVAVGAELSLDVLVAEDAHLAREVPAVGAQDAPVQRDGREER